MLFDHAEQRPKVRTVFIHKNGGNSMDSVEFSLFRKKLQKTQKELAQLLGTSLKAIHSYEQAWRTIPPACRKTAVLSGIEKKRPAGPSKKLLDHQKMPPGKTQSLPCLGISVRRHVLVYLWHPLCQRSTGKMGSKDASLPVL